MKKIIFFIFLCVNVIFIFSADLINKNKVDDIETLKKELNELKQKVEKIEEKNNQFNLTVDGYLKTIWGINFPDNPFSFLGSGSAKKYPIHGFDFENKLNFKIALNNNLFSRKDNLDFSEIIIKLKMETMNPLLTDYKPIDNPYYAINAIDEYGNTKTIYINKEYLDSGNLIFGNLRLSIEEAKLSNILGSGFFINYLDILEINRYYGVSPLLNILRKNNEYFNNNYFSSGNIFYSINENNYESKIGITESATYWSNIMLKDSQKPHGISLGVDNNISEQFYLYIEGGLASKDGFDPKINTDQNIDYGFFFRIEPKFHNDNFVFHPKANISYVFQTNTKEDYDPGWSTLTLSTDLPLKININDIDFFSFGLNTTYKRQFALQDNTFMFGFNTKLNLFKGQFQLDIPVQYWYKDNNIGFFKIVYDKNKNFEQRYEEHILNLSINIGYYTNKLYSDHFDFKFENQSNFSITNDNNENEYFFINELKNKFIFYDVPFFSSYILMKSLELFFSFGYGFANNARYETNIINSITINGITENTLLRIPSNNRSGILNVLYTDFCINFNVTDYFSLGFLLQTPKFLIDKDIIGDQNTYFTIKVYSTISL